MEQPATHQVVVVDVRMPFMSMVSFMVKWAIAAIPAIIILIILGTIASAVFAGLFAGTASHLMR